MAATLKRSCSIKTGAQVSGREDRKHEQAQSNRKLGALYHGSNRHSRFRRPDADTTHRRKPHRRCRAIRTRNRTMHGGHIFRTGREHRRSKNPANTGHLHRCRQHGQRIPMDSSVSWCTSKRPGIAGRTIDTLWSRRRCYTCDTDSCHRGQTSIKRPVAQRRRR